MRSWNKFLSGVLSFALLGSAAPKALASGIPAKSEDDAVQTEEKSERTIPDGDYIIANTRSAGLDYFWYLDIEGDERPAMEYTNVALKSGEDLEECDVWSVVYHENMGYYSIYQKGTGMCLEVAEESDEAGANVLVDDFMGHKSQQWRIYENWNNGYRIENRESGMSLDLSSGICEEGRNVQQWNNLNGTAQSWLFIPYKPAQPISEGRYVILYTENPDWTLDVAGDTGDVRNGANVQLWEATCQSKTNSFDLVALDNGYYRFEHAASSKVLEVQDSSTDNQENIQLFDSNGSFGQQWAIVENGEGYMIIARCSGFALDNSGEVQKNWNNIRQYFINCSPAQTWSFVQAEFTVSFDANGGTSSQEDLIKYYNEDLMIPNLVPTREGYSFEGWSLEEEAETVAFQPGDAFSIEDDTTLYAVWKELAAVTDTPTPTPIPTDTPTPTPTPTNTPTPWPTATSTPVPTVALRATITPVARYVDINETNFPDQAFRKYVKQFDTNKDGKLSTAEINNVTTISLSYVNVGSLKGVGFFSKLKRLEADCCGGAELDLRGCNELEYVSCCGMVSGGNLRRIDVSECPNLRELYCDQQELESLDLSHNPVLKKLSCKYMWSFEEYGKPTNFKSLNLKNCGELEELTCTVPASGLDLSGTKKLKKLVIDNNKSSSLDLSECNKLEYLDCSHAGLSSLNLTNCTALKYLDCRANKLSNLDIRYSSKLLYIVRNWSIHSVNEYGYAAYHYGKAGGEYYLCYDKSTNLLTSGTAPTLTPTPKPASHKKAPETGKSVSEFVERLYTVALGRASEAGGKSYWIDEIESGRRSGADCGEFFLISEEFSNRNLSVEAFVETLYQTFFGRDSEPAGKNYWVGELKSGNKSRTDVIRGFINSTEWCNICAVYGVRSGAPSAKAEYASKNATEFAERLYTCCLGRWAEEEGLYYWSLALTNLEQTGSAAAKLFFESAEFINLWTTDDEYVTRLYRTFMGREPEQDGLNYWVSQLNGGVMSRKDVMSGFASSPEFTNICKSYGIERGTI